MNFTKTTLLTLLPFCFLAQSTWYHYDWKEIDRNKNLEFYKYSYQEGVRKYADNIYIGAQYKKFVLESALSLYDEFNNGNIYPSLEGYENYVRKVLEGLVHDTSISNKIKICFSRSDEFNAAIDQAGFLTINVGLIAGINSEAELALVLGHEVAHYLNNDVIKNYGKIMETKYPDKNHWNMVPYVGGVISIISYVVNNYQNISDCFWFSREQEALADRYSFKLLKESRYAMGSASNVLRTFKREEIRQEIRYGKSSEVYTTHPDPGSRLNLVKDFQTQTQNGERKEFIVDSLAFFKLKEICFQETINIGLINNNLSNVICMSFTQYLLHPEDQSNLAVLLEALRRYLVFGKEMNVYEKPFILSWYQKETIKYSKNYAFLNEKNPSILNHLNKGFVNIWKEDLHKIKATELADTSVIEFTTNMEAYLYFKEVARKNQNNLAEHFKFFGTGANYMGVARYAEINSVFKTNDYLLSIETNQKWNKDLVVVIPPSPENLDLLTKEFDLLKYLHATEKIISKLNEKVGVQALPYADLKVFDKFLLTSLLNTTTFFLNNHKGGTVKQSNAEWLELLPECYTLFKDYEIENLYVCAFQIVGSNVVCNSFKIMLPQSQKPTFTGTEWELPLIKTKEEYVSADVVAHYFHKFYKETK